MPVRAATFGLCATALGLLLYLVLHYVTNSINNAIKEPYMDEIFHIPQAQKYCHANFTYYDKKLTTPPGLYIISYIRIWIRDRILLRKQTLTCDTIDLRRTNHLVTILNFFTLVLIQLSSGERVNLIRKFGFKQRLTHTLNQSNNLDLVKILLNSIAILILPPLFFFNSLYYTDAGSVLFTLLAYFSSLIDQHSIASIFGLISILFRQTNIVWIFYFACLVILRTFEEHKQLQESSKTETKTSLGYCDILGDRGLIIKLIRRCTSYLLLGILFIIFVIINKGIVLGDKEAHQPRLHLAQVLYFLGFCSIFGATWIFHLRILRKFLYFTIRSPLTAVIASAIIVYLIAFGRYAHPYLLADNRHLTFYIWRRILDRHNSYVPYMLTPIYLLVSFSIWHHLRSKSCKQVLLYIACTMLVTVPNGLLEPRYFIIPYILLRLKAETNLSAILIELAQHLAINTSMHYLFLYKTFHWADSPQIQRIMW